MAKKAYIGVDGIAHKIKKGYIGVNGVARKIKKAYIGIGGVARPCWSGGELAYYGTATSLSVARQDLAATTVGDYALFGGGHYVGDDGYLVNSAMVDAYNKSLTRTTATSLRAARPDLAATTIGNYALFGGGRVGGSLSAVVDAYDTSLTRTTPTALSERREHLAATAVGNYALFGGGWNGSYSAVTDAYDTSLTRVNIGHLWTERFDLAATTIGNYALFGGGGGSQASSGHYYGTSEVVSYDASLTRNISVTKLSSSRQKLAATTIGNYALFGGGDSAGSSSAVVDAYDTSLTRTTAASLSTARHLLAATTVGDYALFGGGGTAVDAYDTSLTRTTPTALSKRKFNLAATTIGNYALFGGGGPGWAGDESAVVDAYTVI